MWPFERGRSYNRRKDIHDVYGGQRQGGIITPKDFSLVIIITGEGGGRHGYADQMRADGVFEYFGEGQRGDMKMSAGNLAVQSHSRNGESLLLFRKMRDASLRYEGEWVCQGFTERQAPDQEDRMRVAYVFELRPLEAIEAVIEREPAEHRDLAALRAKAVASVSPSVQGKSAIATIFDRSRAVRDYVLARADGRCEGCEGPAPFMRLDGSPYLESHHVRRLSDGGPDDPRYVIGLCPNCHRRVHAGQDGASYNSELAARLIKLETAT